MADIDIKLEYPLHWLVFHNEYKELETELSKNSCDVEKEDVRGRTALMLAVTLAHYECAHALLTHSANANCENLEGWTAAQEAVATASPDLVRLVVQRRDVQRQRSRVAGIPRLLQRLKDAPDFYVEMRWEFASWVPLVSRLCPSDTYKVWKRGANVRVDTTLLGFEHSSWQRGSRSYIFQGGTEDGAVATMLEVDHETRQVVAEELREEDEDMDYDMTSWPSDEAVAARLAAPIVVTYVDTDKISFERNKGGLWGWKGADKSETVAGHECKVFSASNVQLVTKTRTEHLSEVDRAAALARLRGVRSPLQSLLGGAAADVQSAGEVASPSALAPPPPTPLQQQQQQQQEQSNNPHKLTAQEYFSKSGEEDCGDVGRKKEVDVRVQRFKATLWLAEKYPLSLPEQILPIVDLMAISSSHFAKLKDFIQMQLPAGFPVKIEIPLFHVLNARITFGNIFALEEGVSDVSQLEEEDRLSCVVDDAAFQPPANYSHVGIGGAAPMVPRRQYGQFSVEEEDDLLQFAIQQSLVDAGSEKEEVDIWEALRGQKGGGVVAGATGAAAAPITTYMQVSEEERQLQRAIQASLEVFVTNSSESATVAVDGVPGAAADLLDPDLRAALRLSEEQKQRDEAQRQEEQQQLEEILRLSLLDK